MDPESNTLPQDAHRSSSSFSVSTTNPNSSGLSSINDPTSPNEQTGSGKATLSFGKEFEIELGRGVSEEDALLSRSDKNAVNFVFNYSKLWCKSCKDLVFSLEKRAFSENDCARAIIKQFQALESSVSNANGAPLKKQTIILARMMIDHCKEIEAQNTKRCRELLEVLTRQRTLFDKTRKFLKDKWKADVKRMVDAENSLIKTKSAYYQRCQAGVKLREELATAQNFLNELTACGMSGPNSSASGQTGPSTGSTGTSGTTGSPSPATAGTTSGAGGTSFVGSSVSLTQDSPELVDSNPSVATPISTSSQVAKQRSKVERLEKQLSDNDKKEIELMYAYREAVDVANHRLCDLEKSKVEILCDTRLTITKSDEVVKDSVAELLNQLYSTRLAMIKQYETVASAFQDYVPCSDYRAFVELHAQKGMEFVPEKYHFDGFHESSGSKLDSSTGGRFVGRFSASGKDGNETSSDPIFHSDSDSDGESCEITPNLSSKSSGIVSTSSNVLSTIVEFGSNLFRPDSKKSIRGKRQMTTTTPTTNTATTTNADTLEAIAAHEANLEKEYVAACYPVARCIAAIERQTGGLATHGIYRVPASKAKVSNLMDLLQSNQPCTPDEIDKDVTVLSQEHPLTLASLVKTQLIALPEPLLTYNLYPNFVELGKAFDVADSNVTDELMKRLQLLINHLSPGNRQLAGLIFHHLHRVASCQNENQMGSANLGTMFAPTVLRQRPKFQVANMMEFMDNKGQTKVVELLIDRVVQIFGHSSQYDPVKILTSSASGSEISTDPKSLINDLTRIPLSRTTISNSGDDPTKSAVTKTVLAEDKLWLNPAVTTVSVGAGKGSTNLAGPLPTSSLLRSATISSGNHSRPTGTLLTGALPLYTPFRANYTPQRDPTQETSITDNEQLTKYRSHSNTTTTNLTPDLNTTPKPRHSYSNSSASSTVTTAGTSLSSIKLPDQLKTPDISLSGTSHASNGSSSIGRIQNKSSGLAYSTTTSATTATTAISTTTSSSWFTSHGISSTSSQSSKIPSSNSSRLISLNTSNSISSVPNLSGISTITTSTTSTSAASKSYEPQTNSALSNLVIGRRRPLGGLLSTSHSIVSSPSTSGSIASSNPITNPIDLDKYSFIDTDQAD